VQTQEFSLAASGTSLTYADLRTDMLRPFLPCPFRFVIVSLALLRFTRYGYNMRFVLRPAANLVADYSNNNRWNVLSINAAQFDISNKCFFPKTCDYELKHEINGKKFLGNHELAICSSLFYSLV
jgi:hypothetical protein